MDIGNSPPNFSLIAFTTGNTLCNSSCAETGSDPGRVDSPPTSIISAPSFIISWTRIKTASILLKYKPPSEKESGVIFKIPITFVVAILIFFQKLQTNKDIYCAHLAGDLHATPLSIRCGQILEKKYLLQPHGE